jgi:hypothetical protein
VGEHPREGGMEVGREVLGDEHVQAAVERTSDFTADFQELITRSRRSGRGVTSTRSPCTCGLPSRSGPTRDET